MPIKTNGTWRLYPGGEEHGMIVQELSNAALFVNTNMIISIFQFNKLVFEGFSQVFIKEIKSTPPIASFRNMH